jgi:hypothetical protein
LKVHSRIGALIVLSLVATACSKGEPGQSATPCSPSENADGSITIDCGEGGRITIARPADGAPGPDGASGEDGAQGEPGLNAVASSRPESAGENCPAGGHRIDVGLDENGNGLLDENEVTSTFYVCDGVQGSTGQDGYTPLVDVSEVDPGALCEAGGQRIVNAMDLNRNGEIDEDEITSTRYVCNGVDGQTTLIRLTPEPAGEYCPAGGQRMSKGVDTNRNGELDTDEITSTTYVCDGVDGAQTLVLVTAEAAGANCESAGQRVDTGLDTNRNGVLDQDEITGTSYICNGNEGQVGLTNLVRITSEPGGASCVSGGQRIDNGLDTNRNGVLEASEITATSYVCNGTPGEDGSDGSPALIRLTELSYTENCLYGGTQIDTGLDANQNGVLDDGEITQTALICNGPPKPELAGAGIQQDISLASLVQIGWNVCYNTTYDTIIGNDYDDALQNCNGQFLMLACREGGGDTIRLAAADHRDIVTRPVDATPTAHHVAGTVGWYYTPGYSWGFFEAGTPLGRFPCDVESVSGDRRLCWHTLDFDGGYRCGPNELNFSTSWQRLILTY